MINRIRNSSPLLKTFQIPLLVFIGICLYLILYVLKVQEVGTIFILGVILLGSYKLIVTTITSLSKRQFALDYIALLAITIATITQEYIVAAVLALMIASGRTLEEYGISQAKKSLTKLVDRIPQEVTLWENNRHGRKEHIKNIHVSDEIFIKKGEVIPLDGILVSDVGLTDESSLTGEPYFIEKIRGDQMRSGTINIGESMVIKVTKTEKDSTYKKIIHMVQKAQGEKSPIIRLADRYSTYFTVITFLIAAFAYISSGYDLARVLAVLAIATPCPLILATPVALLGGVNAAAKQRIIVKKLASLEILSKVNTFVFDKTGTITIGKPKLQKLEILQPGYPESDILAIAEAIERNSLHPLAKAIVAYAKSKNVPLLHAQDIKEQIGTGISGTVNNNEFSLSKLSENLGMTIVLKQKNTSLAFFQFEDEIKEDSKQIIEELQKMGLLVYIFTGDKKQEVERIASLLNSNVFIKAECTPHDKQIGIKTLQKKGKVIAMVGDGINDAPALALSDVGVVFSNEEQTAASEAAEIVFLGSDFSQILRLFKIAKRTIGIALQSILWGIGISMAGMVLASFGFIPPIAGAGIQEAIDVAVILNALRASK